MQAVGEATLLDESEDADAEIEAAMGAGVRLALKQHKRRGNTVVVWRDGKTVLLAPEEIDLGEAADTESGDAVSALRGED